MSRFYSSKERRLHAFEDCLTPFLPQGAWFQTESVASDTGSRCAKVMGAINSDPVTGSDMLLALREVKNEVGSGDCDPYLQCSLSYQQHWSNERSGRVRKQCCCPSFLISVAGPWLCVSGAVFLDRVVVDPLMHAIPIMPTEDKREMLAITRALVALRDGLEALNTYYVQEVVPKIQAGQVLTVMLNCGSCASNATLYVSQVCVSVCFCSVKCVHQQVLFAFAYCDME